MRGRNTVIRAFTFVVPLLIPFLWYWVYATSRNAHLERNGTITDPYLKVGLPIIAFLLVISISTFLSFDNQQKIQKYVKGLRISTSAPVVTTLILVVLPYLLAAKQFTYIADLYYKSFRVSNLAPVFADIRTILYGISCDAVNEVGDTITCDPRNSQTLWNYPTFLLSFRSFGLGIDNLKFITSLAIVIFSIAIFLHSRILNQGSRLLFMVLLISPPVLLAFQRMNFDFIIISLLVIGSKLVSTRRPTVINDFIGVLCFASATLLKFYSFPALLILSFYLYRRKISFYASVFVNLTTIFLVYRDLNNLASYVGRDLRGALGFPVLIGLLNGNDDAQLSVGTVGFFLALASVCTYIVLNFMHSESLEIRQHRHILPASLASAFLLPWITTSNYYYRSIILVFLIPFLLIRTHSPQMIFISMTASASLFLSPVVFAIVLNLLLIPLVSLLILILLNTLSAKRAP